MTCKTATTKANPAAPLADPADDLLRQIYPLSRILLPKESIDQQTDHRKEDDQRHKSGKIVDL